MLFSELLQNTRAVPSIDCEIHELSMDSRIGIAGAAFFALQGSTHHGIRFAHQAIENGAVAIVHDGLATLPNDLPEGISIAKLESSRDHLGTLSARFYGSNSARRKVVAFTGTNGKTSCVLNFSSLASSSGLRCGVIGTLGWGFADQLVSTGLTTPDVFAVHRIAKALTEQGCEAIALEASSHALDQGRLDGIDIGTVVFTNISRDHLDFHNSMDNYAAAKSRLFQRAEIETAVINLDSDFAQRMIQSVTPSARLLSYSMSDAAADVFAENIQFHEHGSRFDLRTPWGTDHFELNQLGHFNIANLLAVVAALCAEGVRFGGLAELVRQLGTVPGRMQLVQVDDAQTPTTIVDYAHTPDALAQVLAAVSQHCSGKLWVVFGCGGDRDRGKRAEMAAAAQSYAAQIVVTSDNPRSEDPEQIIADIVTGFSEQRSKAKHIHFELDRKRAIEWAVAAAACDDCVVIAGKGHEKFQIVGSEKIPFDDVHVATAALQQRTEQCS